MAVSYTHLDVYKRQAYDVVTLLSISIAFSERYSFMNPITVFKSTAIKITHESITSPTKYAAMAATIKMCIRDRK